MLPENSLYLAANFALFAVVLLRWLGLWWRGRVGNVVPRSVLVLFVVLQGAALVGTGMRSGLDAVTHRFLATMLMVEVAALLSLLMERAISPRIAGAVVATLAFAVHSYGLVLGPTPPEGAVDLSPLSQSPWYLLHVLGALAAFGAYLCAAGGALAYLAPALPSRGGSAARQNP